MIARSSPACLSTAIHKARDRQRVGTRAASRLQPEYIANLEAEGVIQRQGDGFPLDQGTRDRMRSRGASRLAIGNAIRLMCSAAKSREGDHFAAAIVLRSLLEGFAPTIPDWANDQHTLAGRKLGRGLDHFRKEGAKLIPPPTGDDPYEEEAYRLWTIKQRASKRQARACHASSAVTALAADGKCLARVHKLPRVSACYKVIVKV